MEAERSLHDGLAEVESVNEVPLRAVIGLPAYNHAHRLPEALESLLLQTHPGLRIIVSDDGSTDETPAIVADYARTDPRIVYSTTPKRLGYIGNARHCFKLARQLFPEAEFFAWASDHDVWHPDWLERLVEAFDANPTAVAACPRSFRMEADGTIAKSVEVDLNTTGIEPTLKRFVRTFRGISAGNMIYGLFRADALERSGIMRWQLLPDRLLLCELSLYGGMAEVKEHLWFRRYRRIASKERQRAASFVDHVPRYIRWPWWLAHGVVLWREYGMGREPNGPLTKAQGRRMAVYYVLLAIELDTKRWWLRRERRLVRPVKRKIKKLWWRLIERLASLPGRPHRVFRPIYGRIGSGRSRD